MRLGDLHIKIAFRLAVVILAAMLLIDLVFFIACQQAMVQERIIHGQRFLSVLARHFGQDDFGFAALGEMSDAQKIVKLDANLIPSAVEDEKWLALGPKLKERILRGETVQAFFGHSWGVFWRQPSQVVMVAPFSRGSTFAGAIAGIWSLEPVYRRLHQIQRLVLGYLLVNFVLLEIVGVYFFSRIAVRPLQRLVRRAETYGDEEELFAVGAAGEDDFGRLSHALNRIYGRIQRDRHQLAATVDRLERLNRELGQAQKDVQRAEKLASIGRLSAGLAHEIGNPLAIVSGYLELMGQSLLDEDQRCDIVKRTQAEVSRIGQIMRQLLDLARPSPEVAEAFGVHRLIRETAVIFECQPLTRRIAIDIACNADRDCIKADPERLRQVFLNLMINAADAIQEAGPNHVGCLAISTEATRESIRIVFQDNGVGIAPEHLGLIFDPFFTTKKPGQGTGLGLAVSFLIVEAMGGRLSAKSSPGEGTTFQMEIPLAVGEGCREAQTGGES